MQARIQDFVFAFFERLGVAMSGGIASVALTVCGFFSDGKYIKPVFFVLAVMSFYVACFSVWRVERLARINAQDSLDSHDNIKAKFDSSCVDFNLEFRSDGSVSYQLKSLKVRIFNSSLIRSIYDLRLELKIASDDFRTLFYFPDSSFLPPADSDAICILAIERLNPGVETELDFVNTVFGPSAGIGNQYAALREQQDLRIEISGKDTTKKVVHLRYYPDLSPHFRALL